MMRANCCSAHVYSLHNGLWPHVLISHLNPFGSSGLSHDSSSSWSHDFLCPAEVFQFQYLLPGLCGFYGLQPVNLLLVWPGFSCWPQGRNHIPPSSHLFSHWHVRDAHHLVDVVIPILSLTATILTCTVRAVCGPR